MAVDTLSDDTIDASPPTLSPRPCVDVTVSTLLFCPDTDLLSMIGSYMPIRVLRSRPLVAVDAISFFALSAILARSNGVEFDSLIEARALTAAIC